MKIIAVIFQIIVLYGLYLVGTAIQTFLHLPIPGSIIGMVLLFLLLYFKVLGEQRLREGSRFLLSHLPLLFIPATVGVVNYPSVFKGKGLVSVAAVLISTALVMVVSGWIGQAMALKQEQKKGES